MALIGVLLGFIISLIISSIVIYIATKLLGERNGFGTAIWAALSGAIIFALASYFLGLGIIAAFVGGVVWLVALGNLYSIGWLKSFVVAMVIWLFAAIVGMVLPTIAGPL